MQAPPPADRAAPPALAPRTAPFASSIGAAIVAGGFWTTVAMWVIGFLTHLPGMRLPGPIVFFLLAAALIAGTGHFAARARRDRALLVGVDSGLVAGLICLLILGSVVAGEEGPNDFRDNAALITLGWLLLSGALGLIGGLIGRYAVHYGPAHADGSARDWYASFMKAQAVAVFPLLVVGGLVTSADAGMAVPDWPQSFGHNMFLYPLSRMTGGIYYEHAHRLFGTLVGLGAIITVGMSIASDRRKWIWGLALFGLALVIAQGVLGGLRVVHDSRFFAAVHGVSGQLTFAFYVMLAAFASVRFRRGEMRRAGTPAGSGRTISVVALVFLFLQLLLGVAVRHTEGTPGHLHAVMTHVTNSVLVVIVLIGAGIRTKDALRAHGGDALLRRIGVGILHTMWLQMALGVGALVLVFMYNESDPPLEVLVTTAHQANGAAMLALVTLAVIWTRTLVLAKKDSPAAPRPPVNQPEGPVATG